MTEYPFTQVQGLAHIEQRVTLAEEAVDTTGFRQVIHQLRRQLRGQRGSSTDPLEGGFQGLGGPIGTPGTPQLGEHLRVRQRAMARRTLQFVAGDQGVEVMTRIRGIELARQADRARERRSEDMPSTAEFGAQETVIEAGVMGHETAAREPRP